MDVVVFELQGHADQSADIRMVFDDQNAFVHGWALAVTSFINFITKVIFRSDKIRHYGTQSSLFAAGGLQYP